MLTIGLDVHHCTSTLHILGEDLAAGVGAKGRSITVRGRPDCVVDRLGQIDQPFQIAFEASTGYGRLHDQLKQLPQARRVVVVHPAKLAAIHKNKKKNDKNDAHTLAKLLCIDELPTVWVPPIDFRRWRGLIEHRRRLVQCRSRAKNGLRSLLRTHGIDPPGPLWTRDGVTWLRVVEMPSPIDTLQRDQLLVNVEHYDTMIGRVEVELDRIAEDHPGVALLMTIPGVGPRTAEAVVACIGEPKRFERTRDVGAYFGLIPCQDESAGKARFGHITKEGPAGVRWLLVEAAWYLVRKSPAMRKRFDAITHGKKNRRKIAVVAVARHLACVMLAMLKAGECWRAETPPPEQTTVA